MNLVDSSAWLEYFGNGPNAGQFAPAIEDTSALVVPTLSILEVFKRVLVQRTETEALQAVAMMQQGMVVELSASLALRAAQLGLEHRLPLADSVILATARAHDADLWTQDRDFKGLAGVKFFPKKKSAPKRK